ncbi:MAG: hypothetical protein HXS52_03035 [Theionarchaea archaeon]|nr:hypothetical protein [Theionarchaea archaeon]
MVNNKKRITVYLEEELYKELVQVMDKLREQDSIHSKSESACARHLISLGIQRYLTS